VTGQSVSLQSCAIAQIAVSSVKLLFIKVWLIAFVVCATRYFIIQFQPFYASKSHRILTKINFHICYVFWGNFQDFITGISKSVGNKLAFYSQNGFTTS
jgi:hypothetical protein